MKKINIFTLILVFLAISAFSIIFPKSAQAWVPGNVEGKVEFQLGPEDDNRKVPAVGARVFRTDKWNWAYCPGNTATKRDNTCWGYKDGVDAVVDSTGKWGMYGKLGNNPPPIAGCAEDSGATLCPAGEKGKINYDPNAHLQCANTAWCGVNCGHESHKLEGYFPDGYQLPFNLKNKGYTIEGGSWIKPNGGVTGEFTMGNNEWRDGMDFVYKLGKKEVPVECTSFTGTLKTGPITDLNTKLNFNVKYAGSGVTRVDLVAHGKVAPPAMDQKWYTYPKDVSLDGTYTDNGDITYGFLVDKLVALGGYDRDRLISEGIVYYFNIYGPHGFCKGDGQWQDGSGSCDLNKVCKGDIKLPPPVSKTWKVTTKFICPDGTTPTEIGRRLFWGIWPTIPLSPDEITWNYQPKLDFGNGSTTEITQSITVDNITPGINTSLYIGLVDASYFATWWDDDKDDIKPYKAITSNIPGVHAGTPFGENMYKFAVTDNTVPNNMTLSFEAPEELCVSDVAPMCKNIQMVDPTLQNELITGELYKGRQVAFQCTAEDPSDLVKEYQFVINKANTTPDYDNPIKSVTEFSPTYVIPDSGEFSAKCRVCLIDGICQEWK